MAKKKYTNLGTVMQAKKKDPSDPDEAKRFYLKLEQQTGKDKKPYGDQVFPITLANGKVINSGDILSLQSKKEKFRDLVASNKMTQAKADELAAFLIFDVVLVEELNDENSEPSGDGINF